MELRDNTILICSGDHGLGFELAKVLACENRVILCGHDEAVVRKNAKLLPGTYGVSCDLRDSGQAARLVKSLSYNYIDLNLIFNITAIPSRSGMPGPAVDIAAANQEMEAAYFSALRVYEMFLPLLLSQPEAGMVSITSVPASIANDTPLTINAGHAALHAFMQSLPCESGEGSLKIYEVLVSYGANPQPDSGYAAMASRITEGISTDQKLIWLADDPVGL